MFLIINKNSFMKKNSPIKYFVSAVALFFCFKSSAQDVLEGLVGYWPLDGDFYDVSGNDFHLDNNGNVTFTENVLGEANVASFFNGQSHLSIEQNDLLEPFQGLTLSLWVKVESVNNSHSTPLCKRFSESNNPWNSYVVFSSPNLKTWTFCLSNGIDGGQECLESNFQFELGQWYHVTTTYDSNQMKFYVNGELTNSSFSDLVVAYSNLPLRVGSAAPSLNQNFHGAVDELRIYNRALSNGEVLNLYYLNENETQSSLWNKATGSDNIYYTNGKVSIGSPLAPEGYELIVDGKAIMEEVKVQLSENWWPDFVFKKDYKIRTIEEVEMYISENKHLPEIPSEIEVTENGINLGEMNAKLLQKIEELTLYLIDQNKELKELKCITIQQQAEIEKIRKEQIVIRSSR